MDFDFIALRLREFVWGPVMILALFGTGLFFTAVTGFFQFRNFKYILKNTIGKILKKQKKEDGAITPFQALTTSLAGTVGTGNIAGVAAAIALGGPGAVFWMWVSALLGMMTKYFEVVLAVIYREKDKNGFFVGGPMYYIKNGLNKNLRWLAVVFSVFGALAAFGIGNMVQVDVILGSVLNLFDKTDSNDAVLIKLSIAVVLAIIVAFVFFGGIKRIAHITEKVVPFMSLFYILCALTVIFFNIEKIIPVFSDIFKSAFGFGPLFGGVAGFSAKTAITKGMSRGIFSNEAGLGSSPIAHASTSETSPHKQGLYGIIEVFIDTIVICTLTALAILVSGIDIPYGDEGVNGILIATNAYGTVFGNYSDIILTVSVLFFAVSTIFSWQLYGVRCIEFLTRGHGVKIYQAIFILMIIAAAVLPVQTIWNLADALNGLMALPNLIAILILFPAVIKLTKKIKYKKRDL